MSEWQKAHWHPEQSRRIVARIVVEGDLTLQSPAHFGNGDQDDLTDMPLLTDLRDGKTPLLPGASVAGALRSFLRTCEQGYLAGVPRYDDFADPAGFRAAQQREWNSLERQLFGGFGIEETGGERRQLSEQSSLIVEDAFGRHHHIERRHGVKLDKATRTAEDKKLFDTQLWAAGTTFPLRLELVIRHGDDANALKQALVIALGGFSDGHITLGARKRRGYGAVQVTQWRVRQYDLHNPQHLCDWLENGPESLPHNTAVADLPTALDVTQPLIDARRAFHLRATFALDGSLLIRAEGRSSSVADFVHLQARQADGQEMPILSGTSLAGALRARAAKIANTIGTPERAKAMIDRLFGPEMDGARTTPKASRLLVRETAIDRGVADLVQNRVSIDRFTGGARDTALFNEQPVWGKPETTITMDLRLLNPKDADVGLLLLLLKDLWTGDLPLGGESSVGRGRLKGKEATLTLGETVWQIEDDNGRLQFSGNGSQAELQDKYLQAFLEEVGQ
ncbi:MAG: hypothetical protein KDE59_25915 [Anaerolineales bacterium]|nr:hypothetical protein [Anaerolineales bacterium]